MYRPVSSASRSPSRARAVGAGRDHRELSRAEAPDRVGAAARAAQHLGEQVHRGGILSIGGHRRERHAGERLGMVERLQRQLLRTQREPAHGIEPGRVGDARLAAHAVAVELHQHVAVELGGYLFGVEGMAQELPHAGPQRGVMLGRRWSLGGDQEERGARADVGVVAQCARRREHVHVGERLVEHHDVGRRDVRLLERLGAGVRAAQGVAAPLGELQQLRAGAMIITRDEQLGRTRARRSHSNSLVSRGRQVGERSHGRRAVRYSHVVAVAQQIESGTSSHWFAAEAAARRLPLKRQCTARVLPPVLRTRVMRQPRCMSAILW